MRNALQSIQNPYKNLNAYSIFIKKDSKSKICKQRSNYSTFGKFFFALLTTESRQGKMLTLLQAQKSNDKLAEFYLLHHEKYFV